MESQLQAGGLYPRPCVKNFSIYGSSNIPNAFSLQKTARAASQSSCCRLRGMIIPKKGCYILSLFVYQVMAFSLQMFF